jgi:hypothetical protein
MSTKKTKDEEPKKEEKLETFQELKKDIKAKLEELKNVKRPEINNPNIDESDLATINMLLINAFYTIEDYAANLRALDRKRLNSIQNKNMGFVEDVYDIAMENQHFFPPFLTPARFTRDYDYFKKVRALLDLTDQIREVLWNITIQAADVVYTDALEYYKTVKEGSYRRVDGADTLYRKLEPFFKKSKSEIAEPTKKQEEREAKALISGKHDGEMLIKNVKPKLIAGEHEVVEKKFTDSASIHERKDAEIEE